MLKQVADRCTGLDLTTRVKTMISTKSKTHVKLAAGSRFGIFLKKKGDVVLIEKEDAEEKYLDYQVLINRCQWAVRPERP